jgi:hypothetical protein
MPRWLVRSASDRSICDRFSSESLRSRPAGGKQRPQFLQRNRSVPERLRPKRMTEVVSPHAGQAIATMHSFYNNAIKPVAKDWLIVKTG